jgi:(2R)-sulfolactate sulfo-lyase subunit beta
MYDTLIPRGIYGVFGEASEITGAEHICKERATTKKVGEKWYKMWKAYQQDACGCDLHGEISPRRGAIREGYCTLPFNP